MSRVKHSAFRIDASCGPAIFAANLGSPQIGSPSLRQYNAKAQRGSGTRLLGAKVIDNIEPSGPGKWNADVFVASRNMNARGTIEEVGPKITRT